MDGGTSVAFSPSPGGEDKSRELSRIRCRDPARDPAPAPADRQAAEGFTDGELVTLALNGADTAFSRLLGRHERHLRRLVTRRLSDREDVLDVIQDTHLAVWKALQNYDAGRPFEAWLTSIALNKCKDWARRKVVRFGVMARVQADILREGAGAEERSAESLAMEEESVRDLERALERLPPQLREPLLLTALLDLPQGAVARELGATRKAIEMRVRRARERLDETLRAGLAG